MSFYVETDNGFRDTIFADEAEVNDEGTLLFYWNTEGYAYFLAAAYSPGRWRYFTCKEGE